MFKFFEESIGKLAAELIEPLKLMCVLTFADPFQLEALVDPALLRELVAGEAADKAIEFWNDMERDKPKSFQVLADFLREYFLEGRVNAADAPAVLAALPQAAEACRKQ